MNSRRLAALQASYYIGTGFWPLAHRRSFEWLTGPKSDFWLAQTVGVTVVAIGVGLAHAAARPRPVTPELRTIAIGTAVGLGLIDLVFVGRRRIRPVYLADAAAEAALLVAWSTTRE